MTGLGIKGRLTLLILAAAVFAATLGNMLVPGVLPSFAGETGISIADIGRSSAVFGLGYAVAAPLLAVLARKASAYRVLTVALGFEALTMVAVAFSNSNAQLSLARVAQAIATAAVVPMCTVHAGSIVAPAMRSRALSVSFGGMVVSSLVGAPLGNTLAGLIGARGTFLVAAGTLLCVAGIAAFATKWQSELLHNSVKSHAAMGLGSSPSAWAWLVIGSVFVAAAMEGAATSGLNTFVSPFLAQAVGSQGAQLSALLLCYGVAGLAGNAVMGALADKLGAARSLFAVTIAAAFAVAGLVTAQTSLHAAGFLLAWGFCSWAINPPLQALIVAHAGRHLKLLVAINSSVIFTGSSLGAAIAANQVEAGELEVLPLTAAGLFVLAAVGALAAWGGTLQVQRKSLPRGA